MLDTLLGLIKTTMRRYQRQTGNRKYRTVPRRTHRHRETRFNCQREQKKGEVKKKETRNKINLQNIFSMYFYQVECDKVVNQNP